MPLRAPPCAAAAPLSPVELPAHTRLLLKSCSFLDHHIHIPVSQNLVQGNIHRRLAASPAGVVGGGSVVKLVCPHRPSPSFSFVLLCSPATWAHTWPSISPPPRPSHLRARGGLCAARAAIISSVASPTLDFRPRLPRKARLTTLTRLPSSSPRDFANERQVLTQRCVDE